MERNLFNKVAALPGNANYDALCERPAALYGRGDEIRSPFARDYTRILHCAAFRRLKHKTQVFFNADNDHVCTRLEHVAHVESVANTIAKFLGLNDELTKAVAFGHDLGHAPFGHFGERVLDELSRRYGCGAFWHERGGLRLADKLELLEDDNGGYVNLNLTYAVRDGIVAHCGEVDQNGIKPRRELFDLERAFTAAGEHQPATWEGCVVKISDKIAYIGRDIEDALALNFLNADQRAELEKMAERRGALNTTVIIHGLISDICKNSSPDEGIKLSAEAFDKLNEIKRFNYKNIYANPKFAAYQDYARLALNTLFDFILELLDGEYPVANVVEARRHYPLLCGSLAEFLARLCSADALPAGELKGLSARCKNAKIYADLHSERTKAQAAIDFISGMTDKFAVKVYGELLNYGA